MVGKNILEHPAAKGYQFLAPSSKELDLKDYKATLEYIKYHKPDFVIHAAGLVGGIQANMNNMLEFLQVNMDLGRNIVTACREGEVKNLMNLGSSCMYPKDAPNPLSEELLFTGKLEPTNEGYALAKIVTAKLCEYVSRDNSFFLYKTAIPCNLYGSYDKFDPQNSHMIPSVIRKIHEANEENLNVEMWGDGQAKREFMHASDLAGFIFFAIQNFELMPQYLNVGTGEEFSINEYYAAVSEVIGYNGEFYHDLSKPVGMRRKVIDVTKLREFGWKHNLNLIEGITKTYSYFKNLSND